MNSVSIIGLLRENIDDKLRYFEYELPFFQENEAAVPRVVIKYWTEMPKTRLNVLPINTRVAIQGHLDAHEKFGTIIVVEEIQQLSRPNV